MMVSRTFWIAYARKLSALDTRAGDLMRDYIERNGLEDMESLVAYAYRLVQTYGSASSELACECYDALAEYYGETVPSAEPAEISDYEEVATAVYGANKQSLIGAVIPLAIARLVKQVSADTMIKNARRDRAFWAWIPIGDTCPYCLSLAAEGWKRASQGVQDGDHARHIHGGCDCTFSIRFSEDGGVEGYDPDKYAQMVEDAPGDTEREKLNAMRREAYAQNSAEINAQKRSAYEKRKERESSQAEEIDV